MAQGRTESMTLSKLWERFVEQTGIFENRPDYFFDAAFYAARYPDLYQGGVDSGVDLRDHYERHGRTEGRTATAYPAIRQAVPDLDTRLMRLLIDPELRAEIEAGVEGACELAFELIALGDPIDQRLSDFSQQYYFQLYPDIEKAGLNAFHHFIRHGMDEGRRSLSEIRQNQFRGKKAFDKNKPTCLVCVHEFSKTGAPIVGLDLARSASETHNVIALALRQGPLMEAFREYAFTVLVSESPDKDIEFFHLPDLSTVDFAVLNSVESFLFAPVLVRHGVPFASYLHEFSNYTHPAYKFIFLALFSDLLVFSADPVRDSWANVFADIGFDVTRDSIIIPQADLRVERPGRKKLADARSHLSRLLGEDCSNRKIIYGAGHVQWRKGTDLFVMTAQMARSRDPEALFVWIGDGVNHEDLHFGVWLDKHMQQAEANMPRSNLFFLPAGDYYQDVCCAADVLYLPSRQDPLPNVVFDAARFGCKILLFRQATGFDDKIYAGHSEIIGVDYCDIDAACEALLKAPRKEPKMIDLALPRRKSGAASAFSRISDALQERLSSQRYFVSGRGDYDIPVLFSDSDKDRPARLMEREKMWSYQRRFVWRSRAEAEAELEASDNWVHESTRILPFAWADKKASEYSVHIHAHYLDHLGDDLLYYRALREASRIVVTTDTTDKAARIQRIARDAGVAVEPLVMPNKGRDILPFLRLFQQGYAGGDEIWCHVHQKKSAGTSSAGETWRRFLMAILLGDNKRLSSALSHAAAPETGLVSAFDPHIVDWASSSRLLSQIAPKLPGPLLEHLIVFPVGNMFWTKGSVVAQLNAMFDDDYPWPNEPIANDGTVFHLIERLWPAASAMAGLGSVFLDKPDQKRV
jgi:glycosyltransferase involved in cell wall biosynthesis